MRIQDTLCIFTGYMETLLAVGLMIGWPSMQNVLQREGYFSNLCNNNNATKHNRFNGSSSLPQSRTTPPTCKESEAAFNLIFIIGVFFSNASLFLFGYLFDRIGTWKYRTFVVSLFTLGSCLLAFSSPDTSYLLYVAPALFELAAVGLFASITYK